MAGVVVGAAAPIRAADRVGGDQRQAADRERWKHRGERVGRSRHRDFTDVEVPSLLAELDRRLDWAGMRFALPAGRYETLMPPSTVADLMIYLAWTMEGRGAEEGRTALSRPGGTRIGERLTDIALTLSSDPDAPGLEYAPFVAAPVVERRDLGVRQRDGRGTRRLDPRRGDRGVRVSTRGCPRIRRHRHGSRGQPVADRRVGGDDRRHGGPYRARPVADDAVVHPRGRPGDAAADRSDPRRRLPGADGEFTAR